MCGKYLESISHEHPCHTCKVQIDFVHHRRALNFDLTLDIDKLFSSLENFPFAMVVTRNIDNDLLDLFHEFRPRRMVADQTNHVEGVSDGENEHCWSKEIVVVLCKDSMK